MRYVPPLPQADPKLGGQAVWAGLTSDPDHDPSQAHANTFPTLPDPQESVPALGSKNTPLTFELLSSNPDHNLA